MHAAIQSGGHSPKRMNGPLSTQQLKSGSDGVQNSGTSFSSQCKGKKRDRVDPVTEPSKRERTSKADDGISAAGCKFDNGMIKSEILKITDKGALISTDGVEKLVQLMQVDNSKKIHLSGRVLLADVIAATDRIECLNRFVQIRGVPVLDEWLQEAHRGKTGDGSSSKESDKAFEELLLALLRALDKLPVNLNALQTCNIGKSVNHLRSHKNLEIQKKARSLVDTWKKRVGAEMKTNDARPVGSSQSVTWPVKPGFPEVSHVGNHRNGLGELSIRSSITQQSTCKGLAGKSVHADVLKSTAVFVGPGKLQSSLSPVGISLKDCHSKAAVGNGVSELPLTVVKEEKSSSSQSQNNSQSCSGDHGKTVASSLKEDARSTTAGSANTGKTSGGSSRNRRSGNGFVGSNISGGSKECNSNKSGFLIRNSTSENLPQAGINCERTLDVPASDHCVSHKFIVRLPNPGHSPPISTNGGSLEDPSSGSRASSPLLDKHDHGDHKVIGRKDTGQSHFAADFNSESWESNEVKEVLVECDEGNRLSTITPDEEQRAADETARGLEISITDCSLSSNGKDPPMAEPQMRTSFSSINALIESCAKYSEATTPLFGGDDIGMNLLASVAAGEMSKSDVVSPVSSPGGSPGTMDHCSGNNEAKSSFSVCDSGCQMLGSDDNAELDPQKHGKDNSPMVVKSEIPEMCLNFSGDKKAVTPMLENNVQQSELLSAVKENFFREDENQDQLDQRTGGQVGDGSTDCKSDIRSPVDQIKNSSSVLEKVAEVGHLACDSAHRSLSNSVDCEVSASVVNDENAVIGESSFDRSLDKDTHVGANLIGQKSNSIAKTETKLVVIKVEESPASLIADEVPCPENADVFKDKKFGSSDDWCRAQAETDGSSVLVLNNKADTGSTSSSLGMNVAETIERKVSLKYGAGSDEHHQLRTIVREAEAYPKMPAADVERKEELALSAEISSFVSITEQDAGTMLDFDLNEGILGDDVNQSESISLSAPVHSPAIRKSSLSSLPSSVIINGLPSPITIAAPAKGPFMPPENLLKCKGELGWRGSAATSAFRPAEPRKVLEMPLNPSDVQSPDIVMARQSRPALEIDLNVADERDLEDILSQNFTKTTGSESGLVSNHDMASRAAGGLDLDLNRADEGPENRQLLASTSPPANHRLEVPFLRGRPATVGLPGGEANMLRNFDLNNGPGVEDVGAEPLPRSQNTKNRNNMPYVPPIADLRVNNSDLGAGWFPPGNSYPAVAIPSFLPDIGEKPYPIVAAGAQRILGSVTGAGTFGSDIYRGPVLSSSPAMAFSPAATAFAYAGFPFGTSFPLASTSFSTGSANYIDSSLSGGSYFPPIASSLVGGTGAVSSPYVRPYVISLPESSVGGSEGSKKWGRQGLDLNTGPGSVEEVKDNRLPSSSRQIHATSSQSFIEDQARLYQVAGAVKRKEPDGGRVPDRFTFKQPSWQ